jgi:urea transport system permease protein
MVIWVAVGGRGTLIGAIVGAVGVNWARSILTNHFPNLWPFFLGGLFVAVVLVFPDGLVGLGRKLRVGWRGLHKPMIVPEPASKG